jgi:uncharacterized membrane protein
MGEASDPQLLNEFLHTSSLIMEFLGVAVIVLGALVATGYFFYIWLKSRDFAASFSQYRLSVARGILLGLEFLVAADIIGTVLVDPTLTNVAILGLIVLIRTFLSYSLEIEIHGKLPWRNPAEHKKSS